MNKEVVMNDYFEWLCDMVEIRGQRRMLTHLHLKPFKYFVERDVNRAEDGLALRDKFYDDVYPGEDNILDGECSILELLIGMAIRMNDITIEIEDDDDISQWFWELIHNLKLDKSGINISEIDKIIDIFVYREYKPSGVGGAFPLRRPKEDQRNIELWYQMSAYLNETYFKSA